MSLLKGEGDVLAKGVKLFRRHELVQPPAPREEEDEGSVTSRSISFQSSQQRVVERLQRSVLKGAAEWPSTR